MFLRRRPRGVHPESTAEINKAISKARDGIPEFVDSYQTLVQSYGLSDTSVRFSIAGECALQAMDAVCYAEHLHASETQTRELARLGQAPPTMAARDLRCACPRFRGLLHEQRVMANEPRSA